MVLEEWLVAIDEGKSVDVIYCDFKKVFDKVPHHRLLARVRSYGIQGRLLMWIRGFLLDHQQRVCCSGETSAWQRVMSDIPQGSVLGPLLFILFINSLPDCGQSVSIFMFTDDLKVFCSITDNRDKALLQQGLLDT